MATVFHADDFGITPTQAHALLSLSTACGGHGALSSISLLSNSPAFAAASTAAAPFADSGVLQIALHLNLVEGRPCSNPGDIPLLVDERGMFCRDFGGIMAASLPHGAHRQALREQVERECRAQIRAYLQAFPSQQGSLRVDGHQHVHVIPLVFDALLNAIDAEGCHLERFRLPAEPLSPHRLNAQVSPVNVVKDAILGSLCRGCRDGLPPDCESPLFCGVLLSGRMDRFDRGLLRRFETLARKRSHNLEVLFHPVSVPREECLDPENDPFAAACASPSRDAEAHLVSHWDD